MMRKRVILVRIFNNRKEKARDDEQHILEMKKLEVVQSSQHLNDQLRNKELGPKIQLTQIQV